MSATTRMQALFAHVTPEAAPIVSLPLLDRRRDGEDFPTIPVDGLELSVNETAAALFETCADDFAIPVPDTDTLHVALAAAVRTLGPAGVAEVTGTFAGLDAHEFPEVRDCRRFAYRLALSFWYAGARARPMTAGEAAVALYLSDLHRYRQADFHKLPRWPLLLSRALHQGVTQVPTETLIRLGKTMVGELRGVDRDRQREWLYKQALPDYHRRRFCFDLICFDTRQPTPLIVRPDAGDYLIGLTPPAGPDRRWLRPMRAEW
ncbi:hypothetical protein [Streptomyces sp. URMC 123]|uniref:hypothetical protein n=1 Tax=Streptomyces sp. URMC 123 TaxID=3423403 RepID=UPI003F1DD474